MVGGDDESNNKHIIVDNKNMKFNIKFELLSHFVFHTLFLFYILTFQWKLSWSFYFSFSFFSLVYSIYHHHLHFHLFYSILYRYSKYMSWKWDESFKLLVSANELVFTYLRDGCMLLIDRSIVISKKKLMGKASKQQKLEFLSRLEWLR